MSSKGKRPDTRRSGVRISIRFKLLLVTSVILLLAMVAYLQLAISMFTRDKLAYVFDLNATLVATLSEQTNSDLTVLAKELNLVVSQIDRPTLTAQERAGAVEALFDHEPTLVQVEVFGRTEDGEFERRHTFPNDELMEEMGLSPADFERLRREKPLPFDALASETGQPRLHNSSLPPDAAILTLAVAVGTAQDPLVLVADFRHGRMLRIFGQTKKTQTFLVNEAGQVLAHPQAAQVIGRTEFGEHALVRKALEAKVDRGVQEFIGPNGKLFLGAYARVGLARLTVISQLPKEVALEAISDFKQRSILFGIAIMIVAFIASVFFSRFITAPLRKLSAATEVMGEGNFEVDVQVRSNDEIGDLAANFKSMASAIKEAQLHLVRSERMAAFGQLGAGITHEVKNPLFGISGYAQLAQTAMDEPEKVLELLVLIEDQAKRCNEILGRFLRFARKSEGFDVLDINDMVEETAKILNHQLMIHKVALDVQLGEGVPYIWGSGGELQQVLINMAINAQQAFEDRGALRIATSVNVDGDVVITVADDGPGMSDEVKQRLFEPFFTTKSDGRGTGLGLSISFGIIRDHAGDIQVESQPGKGSTFMITLPAISPERLRQEQEKAEEAGQNR